MSIQDSFGATIKYYRLKNGISQEDLAEVTGLHRTYISDIERGKRNVSLINIEQLAFSLNIAVSELFLQLERSEHES